MSQVTKKTGHAPAGDRRWQQPLQQSTKRIELLGPGSTGVGSSIQLQKPTLSAGALPFELPPAIIATPGVNNGAIRAEGIEALRPNEILGADTTLYKVVGHGGHRGVVVWIPGGSGRMITQKPGGELVIPDPQIEQWAQQLAKQGFEVLLYNRASPETGAINDSRSDFGSDADATDLDHLVADLRARGELRGSPVAVIGHSWGARTAIAYSARHEDRVEQTILIDMTPFDYGDRGAKNEQRRQRFEQALTRRRFAQQHELFCTGDPTAADYRERHFEQIEDLALAAYRCILEDPTATLPNLDDPRSLDDPAWQETLDFVHRNARQLPDGSWRAVSRPWMRALISYEKAREDLTDELGSVSEHGSVLIFDATDGAAWSVIKDRDLPRLRQCAPGATIVELADSDHHVWHANFPLFSELTSTFINDTDGAFHSLIDRVTDGQFAVHNAGKSATMKSWHRASVPSRRR